MCARRLPAGKGSVNGLLATIKSLGPGRIIALGAVAAGLLVLFAIIAGRLTEPSMMVLYSQLESSDSAQIVSELESRGVPYEIRGDGATIMVPSDQVARARLDLAQSGLPSSGSIGYEIYDSMDALGTTTHMQNVNHQRAIEGELSRTIRAIDTVANARVHLVLPESRPFESDRAEPSAAVLISFRSARRIDTEMVRAIQNLVAASVVGLSAEAVSIVDQSGRLLSESTDTADATSQLQGNFEQELERRIEEMVGSVVGMHRVQAEVNAQMNFDIVTESSVTYDPARVVAAETEIIERQRESTEGQNEDAVTVVRELPNPEPQGGNGAQSYTNDVTTEERIRNELSRVQTEVTRAPGAIEKLTVAVVIDGTYNELVTTDADGNDVVNFEYAPRSDAELNSIAELVRNAVGLDESRGDSLRIENLQFADGLAMAELAAGAGVDEVGLLEGFGIDATRLIEIAILGGVALLALLLVIRPALRKILAPVGVPGADQLALADGGAAGQALLADGRTVASPNGTPMTATPTAGAPAAQDDARNVPSSPEKEVASDSMIDIERIDGQVRQSSIKQINEIIDRHPQESVALLREWIYADEK